MINIRLLLVMGAVLRQGVVLRVIQKLLSCNVRSDRNGVVVRLGVITLD